MVGGGARPSSGAAGAVGGGRGGSRFARCAWASFVRSIVTDYFASVVRYEVVYAPPALWMINNRSKRATIVGSRILTEQLAHPECV